MATNQSLQYAKNHTKDRIKVISDDIEPNCFYNLMQVYVYDVYVKKFETLVGKKMFLNFISLTHISIHKNLFNFEGSFKAYSRICNNFSSRYV